MQGEEDTYQYNDLNQMVSKHVCGYEQTVTRIHDYGYTYDKRGNLVKEEEICSPTTTGPKNITVATYLYDETNRMVRGTNANGEVSGYTFNGLGVRVGTELILQDNSHGYTDFHSQTPSVETNIEKPEVVKTDYVIDYTRLGVDQRVLMKSEEGGYDFRYTYGREKLKVFTTGEGSNWWGQSVKQCVNAAYVHTDLLGSVVNLSDQYGRVTARTDYTDWGEVRRTTDITVNGGFRRLLPEITYATHEYDDVLNQFYAKARMYDAENKRFTAMDPIKEDINWYMYCGNNPGNFIDRLGQKFVKLEELTREYGATITIESLSAGGERRVKVLLHGISKYYTIKNMAILEKKGTLVGPQNIDDIAFYIGNDLNTLYVDDVAFGRQWNYVYNSHMEREYKDVIFNKDGYITDQYGDVVRDLRYGVVKMQNVGCELIAIYNALHKLGYNVSLSSIANYYEHHAGMWFYGHWGTYYGRIEDYFRQLKCIKGKRITVRKVTLNEAEQCLTQDNVLVISFFNPNPFTGIHTVMIERRKDGKIYSYNAHDTADYGSIKDFLEVHSSYFLSAYVVGCSDERKGSSKGKGYETT